MAFVFHVIETAPGAVAAVATSAATASQTWPGAVAFESAIPEDVYNTAGLVVVAVLEDPDLSAELAYNAAVVEEVKEANGIVP